MRREFSDELLRSLHGFTTALREEIRDVRRMLAARDAETKYNPNWRLQPRAPRGMREGGQWVGGGGASAAATEPPRFTQAQSTDAVFRDPISGTARATPIAFGLEFDTNGIPTPGWAEPDWGGYPASPNTSEDGEISRMSPEAELAAEAALIAYNTIEELNYRRLMGRSVEDSYESHLVTEGIPHFRNVYVMTREGLRIYDFMQQGPLGWEFVEVKANRAVATRRQVRIDTAVQIFGFSINVGPLRGIQGPTNVRLMRSIPSDQPSSAPEW